eukprot:gene2705-3510_t
MAAVAEHMQFGVPGGQFHAQGAGRGELVVLAGGDQPQRLLVPPASHQTGQVDPDQMSFIVGRLPGSSAVRKGFFSPRHRFPHQKNRSVTGFFVPAWFAAGGALQGTRAPLQAQGGNASASNLRVFRRLHAAHTHSTQALPVLEDRHATLEHAFQSGSTQERGTAPVDDVFIPLALTAAQGGRTGFGGGDGERAQWTFDEEISAVAERRDAPGLLVTLRGGFAWFDPATGAAPRYAHQPAAEPPGNRFNDGKCDAQGRFWGGTMDFDCQQPTGALYRFDPDGQCSRHDEGFVVTN